MSSTPARIVYDPEFVDDDPADQQQTTDNEQPRPSRATGVLAYLADGLRRQASTTRAGLRVIREERGTWLKACNLTDDHLHSLYLNSRHKTWKDEQTAEVNRLTAKAKELEEQAGKVVAAVKGDGTNPKEYLEAQNAAGVLLVEAAAWRAAAKEMEERPYTGHRQPTAADLANHRRRVSNRRRWATAALGLVVGFAELEIGGLLMPSLTAGGVLAAAWAKGRLDWRSSDPEVKPLNYEPGAPAADQPSAQHAAAAAPGPQAQAGPSSAGPGAQGTAAGPRPGAEGQAGPVPPDFTKPPFQEQPDELPEEVVLLNAALTAAGLLPQPKRGREPLSVQVVTRPDYGIGNGYTVTVDLPPGGGKLVRHVLAKADVVAAELSIPTTQLAIREVPAAEGGHGRRMNVWVAEEDPYLAVGHAQSLLADADFWDFWYGVPFGQTILAERRDLPTQFAGGFTSMFFSGMMRFGKTFAMRIAVAAALLDPGVRLYLANAKRGADWRSAKKVAHRFTEGLGEQELLQFEAMLDELTEDMEQRYADLGQLDISLVPEGRLTPELARKHGFPILLCVIDELQMYLLAMSPKRRERVLSRLKNLLRGGPAAGVFLVCGTQRPDGEEVPTGFRDMFGVRVSVRCPDKRSSRMCLGDLASDAGADASVLTEDHVAIAVIAVGHHWQIVSTDYLTSVEFDAVCERARAQREQAGTLSGDAAGDYRQLESEAVRAVRACLTALDELGTDRATLALLARHIGGEGEGDYDEDHPDASPGEFAGIDADELRQLLKDAGCGNTVSLGAVEGQRNASGYKREALEKALEKAKTAREKR
ncbi:hypothetical protein [Streptomyces sp. NRRL S-350]|uniref:hypothetical protein n=1 Tax=Streptomyces sp. NRRL S-350 TaxID=1463902 RepID=UPI00068F865A|nr:hypothetical protein [Streptomyces sp. NRRL S-350]